MKRVIVAVTVGVLLILVAVAAGFVITVHLNNVAVQQARQAVIENRAHGDVTRALICELVRHDHLPDRGC